MKNGKIILGAVAILAAISSAFALKPNAKTKVLYLKDVANSKCIQQFCAPTGTETCEYPQLWTQPTYPCGAIVNAFVSE